MTKLFLFLIAAAILITSCSKTSINSYTDTVDCTGFNSAENTYNHGISAIINSSCASSGCHSSSSRAAGISLDTYSTAKSEFVNGNALCTIYYDCRAMPAGGGKLSDATINQLTCWVANGAPL